MGIIVIGISLESLSLPLLLAFEFRDLDLEDDVDDLGFLKSNNSVKHK